MKRKELQKYEGSSGAELSKAVAEKKEELWKTMNEIKKGTLKNVRSGRRLRKDIAQLMTFMNTKKTN